MQTHPEYRRTWNTPMALWEEPLAGTLYQTATPEEVAESRAAAEALFPLLNRVADPEIRADLSFTARLIVFACAKIETTRAIRATLADLDLVERGAGSGEHARHALDGLIASLESQERTDPGAGGGVHEPLDGPRPPQRDPHDPGPLRRSPRALRPGPRLAARPADGRRGRTADRRGPRHLRNGGYAVLYQESIKDLARLAQIVGRENLPPDIQEWLVAHDHEPTGWEATA